jgi:hypothetical protein
MRDLIEVKLMWIPSHVGLVGNELVDGEVRHASLNGHRRLVISKAWPVLLREWQRKWDLADHGRFALSVIVLNFENIITAYIHQSLNFYNIG